MSLELELKKKLEEMGSAFDSFKKDHTASMEKAGIDAKTASERAEKAEKAMEKTENEIKELKAALARGHQADQKDNATGEVERLKKSVQSFLRKGVSIPDSDVVAIVKHYEEKGMQVRLDEEGGFLVMPELSSEIVKAVKETTPMRSLASVMTVTSDSLNILEDLGGVTSGWVGETEPRVETDKDPLDLANIKIHEIYAMPFATQKLLDDASWNIEQYLQEKGAEEFSLQENMAFMSGNGHKKPRGILSYQAAADATKLEFGKLGHIATAGATIVGDDIINLVYTLKGAYAPNSTFMINRQMIGTIRKLKSNDNQYLWQPGLAAGQPNTLDGRPIVESPDLSATQTAGAPVIVFGDFRKGYQILDRMGIRVQRDAITKKGKVLFYMTKRVGAGVKDFDAIKVLKMKA